MCSLFLDVIHFLRLRETPWREEWMQNWFWRWFFSQNLSEIPTKPIDAQFFHIFTKGLRTVIVLAMNRVGLTWTDLLSDDELMRHSFDLVISKYWANVVNGRANSESNEEYFVSGLEKPWLVKWIVLEGGEDHLKFSEFFHLQRIWFLSWLIDLPN